MIVLLYGLAGLFIVLSFVMLFAYHRSRDWRLLVLSAVYASTGLVAGAAGEFWPLLAGIALAWGLKLAGIDPERAPAARAGAAHEAARDPGEGDGPR